MRYVKCIHCSNVFTTSGINGHLRFRHGIANPSINDYTIANGEEIATSLQDPNQNTYPFPTKPASPTLQGGADNFALEKRRQELEMKKIDVEMARLDKGNTTVDPYAILLKMSEDHNSAMLKMHEQNFDTRLEIERLKLAGSGGDDLASTLLTNLLPMLPDMLAKAKQQKPEDKKEVKKEMDLNDPRLDAYKQMIREGKITETQAWKQAGIFDRKARDEVGRAKFHEEFEKVKNSKA